MNFCSQFRDFVNRLFTIQFTKNLLFVNSLFIISPLGGGFGFTENLQFVHNFTEKNSQIVHNFKSAPPRTGGGAAIPFVNFLLTI